MDSSPLDWPRWWQWPTVLSLDAPAVVVLWQWMLASVARVELRWFHAFVLGASVWLAYGADRWFEAWRLPPECVQTTRHRFYQRRRWQCAAVWMLGLVADLAVAIPRLNRREIAAGLMLLAPVLGYLLSHQLVHRHHRWRPPKEICVAMLLGGGAAVFVAAQPAAVLKPLVSPLILFTALCFVNVALISAWEHEVDLTQGQTSLAHQFPGGATFGRLSPWIIALVSVAMALVATGAAHTAILCVAGSSLLLVLVDRSETQLGCRMARVLADLVLLTPLVPLVAAQSR